jgi:hypothetical protein
MVAELIDHTEARWNSEILNQFLTPMDVEIIQGIPISTRVQEGF